jgi:GABA(A) receptor-associated protein
MKSFIEEKLNSSINIFNSDTSKNVLYTKEEAIRVRTKYPDRIPVIVNRSKSAGSEVPFIDKHKFLVPADLTMGQLQYVIRKRLTLTPDKALFLFVNNAAAPTSSLVSTIYEENKDQDTLFLYVTYAMENTFG